MSTRSADVADAVATPPGTVASPEPEMSHRQIMEALVGILSALFVGMISSTIVANALPTIIADLDGTQRSYTWVVTASLLAMTASTPIWGKLSDLLNKKLLLQLSILLFVAGSVAAGLSQNIGELIGFRAVQGLGMGGLTALSQTVIAAMIPPRQRGKYNGYLGSVMAVATVSGPLLGGVIVDTSWLGWRWCFFACVPLALLALFMIAKTLHLPHVRRPVSVDWLGSTLIAAGVSALLIWVSFAGGEFAWLSWQTAALVGSGLAILAVAVLVEFKAIDPVVPPKIVRERTTALAIIASTAVGIAMFGGSVFLGQYFQIARGYSPTAAGLLTMPMMGGVLVSATVSGRLITSTGRYKRFIVGGLIVLVGGFALLGTIDHTTSMWLVGVYMALVGLGVGMSMQNLVLAVQNTVDVHDLGSASATIAFFRSLGGTIGVSVLGAILSGKVGDLVMEGLRELGIAAGAATSGSSTGLDVASMPGPVAEVVRAAFGDATATIFLISAAVAVIGVIASLFIREAPLRTTVHKEPEVTPAAAPELTAEPIGEGVTETMTATRPAAGDGQGQRTSMAVPVNRP